MSPVLFPPRVVLPICPNKSSLFLNKTKPSFKQVNSPYVYIFSLALKFTITREYLFGLSTELMTCLPVQRKVGLRMVGGGKFMSSLASVNQESISVNSCLVKKTSLDVMR